MYRVSIDGGRVYLDGRLANFIAAAVEHYVQCEDRQKYADDGYYAKRALKKLHRDYDDFDKEHEDVDFSGGWGELNDR
jgi:hypothetical protein